MGNTIDADLLIDTLSNQAVTYLGDVLAPLSAFSTDFSTDELVQTKAVQVPIVTGGSTTLTNPTSFEAGDGATDNRSVTVNHYSQPFHITSAQMNQRIRIEMLARANLQSLGTKIAGVLSALTLAANFTGTAETVAQASFAAANAKSLWGKLGKNRRKVLLLDSVAYAQLAPSDKNAFDLGQKGAYGFDGIFQHTYWTGATANTYGIAAGQDAFCIAAGIPAQVPGLAQEMVAQKTMQIDGLGLPIQMNVWVSRASRQLWASYDLMFGAAAGLADGAIIIKSA